MPRCPHFNGTKHPTSPIFPSLPVKQSLNILALSMINARQDQERNKMPDLLSIRFTAYKIWNTLPNVILKAMNPLSAEVVL